jgi:hypothetical protein
MIRAADSEYISQKANGGDGRADNDHHGKDFFHARRSGLP